MKDVFGSGHNQIILTAADSEGIVKKDKKEKTNMVKIFLVAVPALEQVKDALSDISESTADGPTKEKIDGFIANVLKITEDILDLTKVAVRGVRAEATEAAEAPGSALERPTITPGMISGQENPSPRRN